MPLTALFFGSIGTLAETSDIQRRAFNLAFRTAGLDWVWDRDSYRRMLTQPGGKARIAAFAERSGDTVDVDALHRAKTEIFAGLVRRQGLAPRAGVQDLLRAAKARGLATGFCTSTGRPQVDLTLAGLAPDVQATDFDWIGDRSQVATGKPAPDIFHRGATTLDVELDRTLVIEDTPESAQAALDAGCRVIGFPGWAAEGRPFPEGVEDVVTRLSPDILLRDGPAPSVAAE
ncbi:MAG: HAD-IA family hydrolase [Pseudomonadota bacterium]